MSPGPSQPGRLSARAGALAGILAGSVALLVLLAGVLVSSTPGFLEAVANGVTIFVPLGLFDAGIAAFGSLAKGLLFVGVCLGTLVAGAVAGALAARLGLLEPARRSSRGALLTIVAIAAGVVLLAELVVLPIFDAGAFGFDLASDPLALHLPLVVASVSYAAVFVGLARPGSPAPAPAATATTAAADGPWSATTAARGAVPRRVFIGRALTLTAVSALGLSAVTVAGRVIEAAAHNSEDGRVADGSEAADEPVDDQADAEDAATPGPEPGADAASSAEPLPSSGTAGATADDDWGPTAAATSVKRFYVVAKDLVPPRVDADRWRLTVTGLVDRTRRLSYDEIRALPTVEGYRTLQCISNEVVTYGRLIGNQRWKGVRARDVIELAGIRPGARWVLWRSADGYRESLPLEVALDDRTWLVYEMGRRGSPLSRDHGFPLRVLIAGRYGMKQPKWLTEIRLADLAETGYWERRGWDETAAVRTYSRIDAPRTDGRVPSDRPFMLYGIASAGDRGIAKVELTFDGRRTWQTAELEPKGGPIGELTWVRWRLVADLGTEGGRNIEVRATDGRGNVQDATPRPPLPSGATGLHRIRVIGTPGLAAPSA